VRFQVAGLVGEDGGDDLTIAGFEDVFVKVGVGA